MGCLIGSRPVFSRYVLSNILNTETVSFSVATEGAMLLPGDICLIGDPLKTDIESAGRIKLATSSTISCDRELTSNLDMSKDWYVYTYGPSGIAQRNEVKSVSGTSITIEGSFSSTPSSAQMFMLVNESDENTFRRYRVQSVKEGNDGTFDIVAILYVERKFEYIDDGDLLDLNSGISYGSKTTLKSGNQRSKEITLHSLSITQLLIMKVEVAWEPNTLLPYAALDPVVPGKLFSQEIDDTRIDGYRIEQFDFDNDIYLDLPNTTKPFSEFDAKDNVAVKLGYGLSILTARFYLRLPPRRT